MGRRDCTKGCNLFLLWAAIGKGSQTSEEDQTGKEGISLKEKEILFCKCYSMVHNPKEAAILAGYSHLLAERTAHKLLIRDDVNAYLEKFKQDCRRKQMMGLACKGLKRLAFGRANDAAELAIRMDQMDGAKVQQLDLFSVSEMKRNKDGGFEFRFADRIKALEALAALADRMEDDSQTENFLKAFERSARELEDGT